MTVPLEFTEALPPPADCTLVEASAPMTAMEVSPDPNGSTLPEFFRSTVPCSARCSPAAWLAVLVAVAAGEPVGGLSNSAEGEVLGQDPGDRRC